MTVNAEIMSRIGSALGDEEPVTALRGAVRSLIEEGWSRRALADQLEECRATLADDQAMEDEILLDVMAILDGWASNTAVRNLLPTPCVAPHALSLGSATRTSR